MDEKELIMQMIDGITSQDVTKATDSFRELTDIKIAKLIARPPEEPQSTED